MSARTLRAFVALMSAATVAAGTVATAESAAAATPGIRQPRLTVVCSMPHHGQLFTAVRYRQRGLWAANGKVTVTITTVRSERPRATLSTRTGPAGWFHIDRTLVRKQNRPWHAGSSYVWTTVISGDSWATARRGTVVLRNTC